MLLRLIMGWFMFTNVVEPMNEQNDDRDMYVIHISDKHAIEHAYIEEVYNWIETGEFVYNEALEYPELTTDLKKK